MQKEVIEMAIKMYIIAKKAYIGWTWDALESYFFLSKKLLIMQINQYFKGKEDVGRKICSQIEKNSNV